MRAAAWVAWAALLLGGCGQTGPLYLPDKNAAVVTSAPAAPSEPAATPPTPKKPGDPDADTQPPQ